MEKTVTPSVFWAKLQYGDEPVDDIQSWHPLVAHSADVAAVTEQLLTHTRLGVRLARLLQQDELITPQIHRLCTLAALHDAGKTNQGFQNRAFGSQPYADHVRPMVAMLSTSALKRELTSRLGLQSFLPWFGGNWSRMFSWLQTTWSHHGAPVSPEPPEKGLWTDRALDGLSTTAGWTRRWYPHAVKKAPSFTAPQQQHLFNGILTLADWIASDTAFFPLTPSLTDPTDAIQLAKKRASQAVSALDLTPSRDVDTSLTGILGGYDPYPVQRAVQNLSISQEGTLSILESPTGSGKTEGAIGRYARLLEKGRVDSMFFAVPTRAAATQLHDRVQAARDRMFGEDDPPVHLAVPGYLKVDDVEGTRAGWNVRWDEALGPRGWAAESSKRYTSSPIAVGTIDQVLMSVLRRKHAHLRLAGLARSFIVIDEVHASSPYMNELLQEVLWFHREMGGHALLMSATLGSRARSVFTGENALPLEEAKAQAYPLISHVNGTDLESPIETEVQTKGKTVSIRCESIMQDSKAIARHAEEAATTGAHVLVIRNTVAACQATHEAIDSAWSISVNDVPAPHHSRYSADDRKQLDNEIERRYGKHEVGEGEELRIARIKEGGVIAVATQTVEQSLDIDADYLITDLCPMDVLLQRMGRLHRHRRDFRPEEHKEAKCLVLTPAVRDVTSTISEKSGRGFPGPGLGSVYGDLRIIEATWRALERRKGRTISIPGDNRALVEEATHPEVTGAIEKEMSWEKHAQVVRQMARAETLEAKNNLVRHDLRFTDEANQFPSEQSKTRLGEEDIVVDFPTEVTTPFGNHITELTLSPYLFDERPENGEATLVQSTDDGFTFAFADQTFTYSALGIQKAGIS